MKPDTLEDWHPQHRPAGRKRCITQSMRLHLTDAIRNDIEHYRSTFIRHNPTVWITCQHNMYVVPLRPNQQRSSGDKVCNILCNRGRETRKCTWTCGYAMSPAQGPIDLIGGWWHWLSSGSTWIRSLTEWAQERDGPPPTSGSRLVGANQSAGRQAAMISPRGYLGGKTAILSQ